MSSSKAVDYDYYSDLYTTLEAESREYAENRFKKERAQKPAIRVFYISLIFTLCIGLVAPLTLIIQRQAEIHERQFGVFRLKEVAQDYRDRSNELKEALESNSSMEDLELYATERLDMVKAENNNFIVVKPFTREIKKPSLRFSIATRVKLEMRNN